MPAIIAIFCAFLLGLYLKLKDYNSLYAWFLSSLIVPVFVMVAEFIVPYTGGGASLWPIALMFGGILGFVAGGIGVFIGALFSNKKKDKS